MKLITAVVQPGKLDEITRSVTGAGARGLTATDVLGFGQQYGHVAPASEPARRALLLRKVRIDIVVQDEAAEAVVDAIAKCANTGTIGDGKIWVTELAGALRVRTGERDRAAI
jgi:nitrogen regulatory protein P-II 1